MLLQFFLAAAIISFLTTPIVIVVYRRIGLVDFPDPKKPMTTHDKPVPRGGGIPIFVSIMCCALLFIRVDQHLVGIMIGMFILAAVGVLDDRYNLHPYIRLPLLFLAAGVVVASGIGIAYITVPFVGLVHLNQPQVSFELFGQPRSVWMLADMFALFWIVSVMNFVNWSKGLDGQLPGIVVIAALVIGALSLKFSADITQWPVIILALVTAGAYAGFLPWNFYPQKIMPGYGGGIIGGYMLAVLSLLSTTKVGTLLVVLGIPLIDALFTIIRRVAHRKSPVWGDRGHLHHRLLDAFHWSKRRIALFYWATTAAFGLIALQLNSKQKFYTMLAVGLALGGALIWINYFGQSSKRRARSGG